MPKKGGLGQDPEEQQEKPNLYFAAYGLPAGYALGLKCQKTARADRKMKTDRPQKIQLEKGIKIMPKRS